jgi:hypothetical protein
VSIQGVSVRREGEDAGTVPATDKETTMPHYLLSVYNVEGEQLLTEAEYRQAFEDTGALGDELMASGAYVFGGGLHADAASTATVVRSVDGKVVMTDGPFAETKESLGGFCVIDVKDLDEALAWAAREAAACRQPVEVRPFLEDFSDLAAIYNERYERSRHDA